MHERANAADNDGDGKGVTSKEVRTWAYRFHAGNIGGAFNRIAILDSFLPILSETTPCTADATAAPGPQRHCKQESPP